VGIILFHVLLLYGLVSGLARKVVEVVAAPLVTDMIEEVKPEDKPPPPPPPQMERPPVQVPPPDIAIDIPMETNTTAISNVTDRPVPPPAPVAAPVRQTVRVGAKLDLRRSPSTDEFYPASARRAEIQGVTTVRMCVGVDGKMSQEPTVANSSGSVLLPPRPRMTMCRSSCGTRRLSRRRITCLTRLPRICGSSPRRVVSTSGNSGMREILRSYQLARDNLH
jgi:protein TonB